MNPLSTDLDFILENTKSLWKEFDGKKIFVTGGTGFFGCWLLESFLWIKNKLDLNCQMHVLTRNPEAFKIKAPHLVINNGLFFHIGDIKNFNFFSGKYDYIIHAATEASAKMAKETPKLMYDTIVDGTNRILEFASYCSAKKLLFTSSGAVYGSQPPRLSHLSEDYIGEYEQTEEKAPYGMGKKTAETMCIDAAKSSQLEIKIARCFAFVGPYLPLDTHFAIGNFILAGINKQPISIKGDGTPYRSYLYAADLMVWLWNILVYGESCRPYNVGSEDAINIADLAHVVASHFDPSPNINIAQSKRAALAERYVPSTERARKELKLQQRIDLNEAIERTKNWYLHKLEAN